MTAIQSDGRFPGTTSSIGAALIALAFLVVILATSTFFACVAVRQNFASQQRKLAQNGAAGQSNLLVTKSENDILAQNAGLRSSTKFSANPLAAAAVTNAPATAPPIAAVPLPGTASTADPSNIPVPAYLRPAGSPGVGGATVVANPLSPAARNGVATRPLMMASPASPTAAPGGGADSAVADAFPGGVRRKTIGKSRGPRHSSADLSVGSFFPTFYSQLSTHANVRRVAVMTFAALSVFTSIWLIVATAAPWASFSYSLTLGGTTFDQSLTATLTQSETCLNSKCEQHMVSDSKLGTAFLVLLIAFLLSLVTLVLSVISSINILVRHNKGLGPLCACCSDGCFSLEAASLTFSLASLVLTIVGLAVAGSRFAELPTSGVVLGKAAGEGAGAMAVIYLLFLAALLVMLIKKPFSIRRRNGHRDGSAMAMASSTSGGTELGGMATAGSPTSVVVATQPIGTPVAYLPQSQQLQQQLYAYAPTPVSAASKRILA
jgi:hypothetical protein